MLSEKRTNEIHKNMEKEFGKKFWNNIRKRYGDDIDEIRLGLKKYKDEWKDYYDELKSFQLDKMKERSSSG